MLQMPIYKVTKETPEKMAQLFYMWQVVLRKRWAFSDQKLVFPGSWSKIQTEETENEGRLRSCSCKKC